MKEIIKKPTLFSNLEKRKSFKNSIIRRPSTRHWELPVKITRGKSIDINDTVFEQNCRKCMRRF